MQGNLIENRSSLSQFTKITMQFEQINKSIRDGNLSHSRLDLLSTVESSLRDLILNYPNTTDTDVSQNIINCINDIDNALSKHKIEFTKRQCIWVILTAGMYALYSYRKYANDVNFVRSNLNQLDNNRSFSKDDIELLADSAVEFSVDFLKMEKEEARKEVRYHFESIFGGTVHNSDCESFEKIKSFVPQHYFNESTLNLVELWYIRNMDDDSAADVRRNYLYHKIDKILNHGGEMTDKQIAERKGIFGKRAPLKEVEVRQNKVNSILNVLKEVYIGKNEGGLSYESQEKNTYFCLCQLEKMFSKHEQRSLVNLIFGKFEEIRATPTDPSKNVHVHVNDEGYVQVDYEDSETYTYYTAEDEGTLTSERSIDSGNFDGEDIENDRNSDKTSFYSFKSTDSMSFLNGADSD